MTIVNGSKPAVKERGPEAMLLPHPYGLLLGKGHCQRTTQAECLHSTTWRWKPSHMFEESEESPQIFALKRLHGYLFFLLFLN